MRIWNFCTIISFGCIFALHSTPRTSALDETKDANDYVYDEDTAYGISSTSTVASTRSISLSTVPSTVELLTTIVSLLISGFTEDLSNAVGNQTATAALVTTSPSATSFIPLSTNAPQISLRNQTDLFGDQAAPTTTSISTSPIPFTSIAAPISVPSEKKANGNAGRTSKDQPAQIVFASGNESVQRLAEKDPLFGNGTVQSTIERSSFLNGTVEIGSNGSAVLVGSSTFTAASDSRRFLVPAHLSGHGTVESASLTDGATSTDAGLSITGTVLGDAVTFTRPSEVINVSASTNARNNDSTDFPTPPSFHDMMVNANGTASGAEHEAFDQGGDTLVTRNQTTGLTSQAKTTELASSDRSTTVLATTTSETVAGSEMFSKYAGSQANNDSCSHRLSEALTVSENESIVTLHISSAHKWNNNTEALVCRFISDVLCGYFEDRRNVTSCAGLKLEIVDEPSFLDEDTLLHLLFLGPDGLPLHGKNARDLLKDHQQALELLLAMLQSNRTNKEQRHSLAPSAHRPFDHPLDDPVIATSVIAVVVTVCSVAVLSLLILVILQRRRRSRKGEWIVNKKNAGTSAGAHLAYGWCFENDGYSNDEKKRSVAPLPPVQLLDDRRQRLTLPVDSPPFDVNGANAFPVPPPPPLNSFNGCDNGYRADQLASPPLPQAGSSFNGWATGGRAVEMEMTEANRQMNRRWLIR